MKKVLAILAVAGFMAACNSGNDESTKTDSTTTTDTMTTAPTMTDTSHTMMDSSSMGKDSTGTK